MSSAYISRLASYGQWTYRAAWALEIIASLIGLATGLALGIQAFTNSSTATTQDLILASAPFFMVSLAELTKIPIATLLYASTWIWKPVLLVLLIILAGITFETVFMGLERAARLRQMEIEDLTEEKRQLLAEKVTLEEENARIRGSTQVADAKAELDRTFAAAAAERANLQEQIEAVSVELEGQATLTPEAAHYRDLLAERKQQRTSLIEERDKEIDDAVAQFERQRDSYVKRLDTASDPATRKKWEDELQRLVNPRPAIIQKYEPKIADLDRQIGEIQTEFDRLRAQAAPLSEAQQSLLTKRKLDLAAQLNAINEKWSKQIDAARERLAKAQELEANGASAVAENQKRQDAIARQVAAIDQKYIPLAREDQVRRIAGKLFGKDPEDVTSEEAGMISLGWFGSLAFLAALAGPITAIVALGLQRKAALVDGQYETKLSRLIRSVLLGWRWRRVRSVPVRVEVPVDREVEKIVEKPVEKVVKEILYVPLLTDDPDAVRRALSKRVPKEVADLVKVRASAS